MPRHRHTFALIIISFSILATVITAFRVRDLPKSDLKSSVKRQKCKDCGDSELNLDRKLPSFKIDSSKDVYEDLKKTVREKQKLIKIKSPEFKFQFSHEDEDDDDDDDDNDLEPENQKQFIKVSSKKGSFTSSVYSIDNDDDDDDDDDDYDDGDNDKDLKSIKDKKVTKGKTNSETTPQQTKVKKGDSDDDDNDDDEDDNIETKLRDALLTTHKNQKQVQYKDDSNIIKKNSLSEKQKHKVFINDDNDDDDDDELDEKSDSQKSKQSKENKKVSDKNLRKDDNVNEINYDKRSMLLSDKKEKAIPTPSHQTAGEKESSKTVDHAEKNKPVEKTRAKDIKITLEKPKVDPDKLPPESMKGKAIDKPKELKPVDKKDKDSESTTKKHAETQTKLVVDKVIKQEPHKPTKDSSEHKQKKQVIKELKPKSVDSGDFEDLQKSKHDSSPKKKDSFAEQKSVKQDSKHEKHSSETYESEEILQRQEAYLKQVTEALHRRNLLQSEFEDFYAYFPTFAPNFSRIHNPECRRHGQILLRQLRGTKLWALNMLDSTAKIPSGILQGNGIQLGDFDQCLGSHARVQLDTGSIVRVQGKYCLARIDIKAEHPELEVPVHLAQAKNLFKSRIDDPGHFVPRFSTLSWGVCVPATCNPEDVEVVFRDTVKHYQHTSGIIIKVKVEDHDCYVDDADWLDKWLQTPIIATLSLYAVVILLVIIATVKDFWTGSGGGEEPSAPSDEGEENVDEGKDEKGNGMENKSEGFLSAFSLYRTLSTLTSSGASDDITCIHGVRGVATIALLIAHKILPVAVTPYTNRVKITEIASSAVWSWARAGWVFTDCFLLLSGTLTAYRITADSQASALSRILSRYLRLTPALLAVVLFYSYVWDSISSGPMWGTLVTKNADVCRDGWWWNLLYVQNYFGFEDMCAPQTHQLALDMQLSILGGIVVWCLQVKPGASNVALVVVHALTAYSRYTTVRDHRLTLIAYHGVSVSQLYRTARLTYTSTLHRSTAYLIGLSLGLALQNPKQHGKIVLAFGWLLSTVLCGLVWYVGLDSGYTAYHYSASFAAQYAALAPIAMAVATAWLIYAVHSSGKGILSSILCCRPLVFISRLSYAIYLCQFVVYLTNAATVRTSSEFTLIGLLDIQEISYILLVSALLTVTFIIPMQSLKKIKISLLSKSESEDRFEEKPETENKQETIEENGIKIEQEMFDGIVELPLVRRSHLIAHREVLEEIPEVEIEYEMQRDQIDGLEEIIEEEEDEEATDRDVENPLEDEEDIQILDDDMEIIEEEVEGGEDFWADREVIRPRRSLRFDDDDDPSEEWEHSANSNSRYGNGAQQHRYSR